jgi:LysM repeat protein
LKSKIMRGLTRYWRWTTSGTKWRLAGGIGGPLLLALVAIGALTAEEEKPTPALTEAQTSTTNAAPQVATTQTAPSTEAPTQPPPPPAAPTPVPAQTYRVVAGDNPTAIASKLGVPPAQVDQWVQQFLVINNTSAAALQVGQDLKIPPVQAAAAPLGHWVSRPAGRWSWGRL